MSDNMAGASPEIVQAALAAATGQVRPYGNDGFTAGAVEKLNDVFGREVDAFSVSTGTAANCIGLAALVPPWGGILCHANSHINTDECGAPEAFTGGAKLISVPGKGSKIEAEALRAILRGRRPGDVHCVQPSVLSISQPTESGSVYSIDEIRELCQIAKGGGLRVHMDGARFANALVHLQAADANITAADMTWRAGVDILAFGLTKNGAMTVDLIVSFDKTLYTELAIRQKRAGQLTSKMRFQMAQIAAYLSDDLWLHNARHSNKLVSRLGAGLTRIPGPDLVEPPTSNMLFCHLSQRAIEGLLSEGYTFYYDRWGPGVVRFVLSFAHSYSDIEDLLQAIHRYYN